MSDERIDLRDTYRSPGCRGGVGLYTMALADALCRCLPGLTVVTAEPEAYPGCRCSDGGTRPQVGIRRASWLLVKLLRPDREPEGASWIIYPHPFEPQLAGGRSKRLLVIHDLIPLLKPTFDPRGILHYLYYRVAVKKLAFRADRIIAISESTKKDLIREYRLPKERITVIYPGLISHRAPGSSEVGSTHGAPEVSRDYILYVGNASPHKNLGRLLKAFALLKKQRDLHLVLVGAENRALRRLAARQGISESVKFLGIISGERLSIFLSGAKALVQPSLYEGFGLPPLESMAFGVPVVCSRAASLPEVCGDAAVYFDPEDVPGMAEALKKAVFDDDIRQTCIRNGLKQARKFDWGQVALQFKQVLSASSGSQAKPN